MWEFVELAIGTSVIIFCITQIMVPAWRGTPFFPIFRRERKLTEELQEAREHVLENKLETAIKATEGKASKNRREPEIAQVSAPADQDKSDNQPTKS